MTDGVEQGILDYKISVEYQCLSRAAPAGVMVLPEINNIRKFHGVAFVRVGAYRQGVFMFTMVLPADYNSAGSFPSIVFTPPIFNPLVNSETGKMALVMDGMIMREWDPTKNFLSTALSCVKRMFHAQNFEKIEPGTAPNEYARQLFDEDREAFNTEVLKSVDKSLEALKKAPQVSNPFKFSTPLPAHEFLRQTLVGDLIEERGKELQKLNRADHDVEGDLSDDDSSRTRRDSYREARAMLEASWSSPGRRRDTTKKSGSIIGSTGGSDISSLNQRRSISNSTPETTPKKSKLQSFFDLSTPPSPTAS